MLNFADAKEIVLRPYQASAIEKLREKIRAKVRRLILCAGTGAGKTLTAASLLNEADRKGSYALFIVDRVALVDQTSAVFDEYGIRHGIVQGINQRWAPRENVQVVSAQTLARRILPRSPDLIVVDECHCFVAGTQISTPAGMKNIEDIKVGDEVFNATGSGIVQHSFQHSVTELVRVSFDDGTSIVCTPEHRFFTPNAWVQARFMDGQSAFCIEDMPYMWRNLSAVDPEGGEWELVGGTRAALAKKDILLSKLCEEIAQPDAPSGGSSSGFCQAEGNQTSPTSAGREWERSDRATASTVAKTWAGLDYRVCGPNPHSSRRGLSDALQDRLGQSSSDDRHRGGRRQPLQLEGAREGCTQGRIPALKRVVSVQSVECESPCVVFNLAVSGHPSYFAEGVLVHNCQYQATLDFMARYPDAVKVGLTATPFTKGMGLHWDGMVNVIPTRELINDGYLVEPKIFIAKSPEDAEYGRNSFGEFSDQSAASAGIKIIGDVVAEWVKKTHEYFGGPEKTIVFSPTVEHGRELCAEFAAAGYNFQQISYLDKDDAERAEKIAEFRRPDSIIHGLVSCGVLTKGFDVPEVRIGVSCKPYRKSLSSHMQEIGRLMRVFPGEDQTKLWLDHSGNFERFALDMYDIWENGPGELDKAEKQDSKPRERNEKTREAVVCPECSGGMRGSTCMSCGWERPARSNIHAVAGEMCEFDPATLGIEARSGLRAECLKNPRAVWEAALSYCMSNTRKGPDHARKWAYGVWRGVFPGSKLPFGWYDAAPAVVLDTGALSLIEREVRRFRKGSGNMRRAA